MADDKSKKGKQDRNQVSGSENYEIQYFKDKLGVTSQAVTGAIRARQVNEQKRCYYSGNIFFIFNYIHLINRQYIY